MFHYFGYGSNLDLASLPAKGVQPVSSSRGVVVGWRLRFNVAHFFRHEGGVANIERTGNDSDRVHGVVHRVEEDVAVGERTPAQQAYLNTLLYSDAEEYPYVGRLVAEG